MLLLADEHAKLVQTLGAAYVHPLHRVRFWATNCQRRT